jgi:hypothetical protein
MDCCKNRRRSIKAWPPEWGTVIDVLLSEDNTAVPPDFRPPENEWRDSIDLSGSEGYGIPGLISLFSAKPRSIMMMFPVILAGVRVSSNSLRPSACHLG